MINFLKLLCFRAIINKIPFLHKKIKINDIDVTISKNDENFHYQFNGSMKIAKIINSTPMEIAYLIEEYIKIKIHERYLHLNITHPGFINFIIKDNFINKKLKKIKLKIKKIKKEKIIIDYSSPNIAKDMHVGHLRSTIIGDCISRILKYAGHTVIKINHLGDWGTQFGILIAYIKEKLKYQKIPKDLHKLSILYKEANKYFDSNENFKKEAKNEVVNLQKKENNSIKIWILINKISKKEYEKVYKILDIQIKYKGESFYNDLLNPLIKKLEKKNIVEISEEAKCIYIEGFKNKNEKPLPLIIKKSDGGFNYATTDLAALYYRIKYNKANKIIYITDVGQKLHFKMLFKALEKSEINKHQHTKLIHIPIGLMLNDDGKKIKTRAGKSEKLIDLLNISIKKSKEALKKKGKITNKKTLDSNAKILGINIIKYSDLSNKIDQNYIFDYSKILQFNGNTAAFINYAYVRIRSIKKRIKKEKINLTDLNVAEKSEINLALHILEYENSIKKTIEELNPNVLTYYLYKLSEKFHSFFHECNIIKSEKIYSRLYLCNITEKILIKGMLLLGMKKINQM